MRITCTATKRGNVYRFFKNDDNFQAELKPLIPLLLACDGVLLVGDEEDSDTAVLITAGPMNRDSETELLRRAGRHLDSSLPPEAPVRGSSATRRERD